MNFGYCLCPFFKHIYEDVHIQVKCFVDSLQKTKCNQVRSDHILLYYVVATKLLNIFKHLELLERNTFWFYSLSHFDQFGRRLTAEFLRVSALSREVLFDTFSWLKSFLAIVSTSHMVDLISFDTFTSTLVVLFCFFLSSSFPLSFFLV